MATVVVGGLFPRSARICGGFGDAGDDGVGPRRAAGHEDVDGNVLVERPSSVRLSMKTLVVAGQEPMATTALGPQHLVVDGLDGVDGVLRVTGPVTQRMSAWRGLPSRRTPNCSAS
jgi:hypothetical protein